MEHSTNPIEPIHQFQITNLIPLGNWGGQEIAFTNSALFMVLTVAAIGDVPPHVDDAPGARSGPLAADGGDELRVRRQHGAKPRRARKR